MSPIGEDIQWVPYNKSKKKPQKNHALNKQKRHSYQIVIYAKAEVRANANRHTITVKPLGVELGDYHEM